jgi:hypothetical protein
MMTRFARLPGRQQGRHLSRNRAGTLVGQGRPPRRRNDDYLEQGFWYETPGASCVHCAAVMGLAVMEQSWSAACRGLVSRT